MLQILNQIEHSKNLPHAQCFNIRIWVRICHRKIH